MLFEFYLSQINILLTTICFRVNEYPLTGFSFCSILLVGIMFLNSSFEIIGLTNINLLCVRMLNDVQNIHTQLSYHLKTECTAGQALSRSYGRFFAEFLKDLSLVRLGLLDPTTCVGLRYGTTTFNLRSFSRKRAPLIRSAEASRSDPTRTIVWRICLPHILIVPAPIQ